MTTSTTQPKGSFLETGVPKALIAANMIASVIYLAVVSLWFPVSNIYLFLLLLASQLFFTWQTLSYLYTIWDTDTLPKGDITFVPPVDVFITVAGEPADIVEETVAACVAMDYPNFNVHILNDGYVAKKSNWRDMITLAKKYGINCITRTVPGGAKAGNINHALKETDNPFVVIFDADHVPHEDFLRKTIKYFGDDNVAFVQSPQYYKNYETNEVTGGAWEQQELFFGPICKGKNRLAVSTMCGTNMVIRRTALEEVGGMCDTNIAEDFVTGLLMHKKGWNSVYVPEILAEGLAPEDFLSYYKQQLRWARGSLEVLFKYNPLFSRNISFGRKVQYLASASYYLSGVFVLINALIPLIFFFTGAVPFLISTMALAAIFLPYMFLTIYTVQLSSNFTYTFRALAFSMSSWPIHLQALWGVVTNRKASFAITSKRAVEGNFIKLVRLHIAYIIISIIGTGYGLYKYGLSASVSTNVAWVLLNCAVFVPFIKAALPQRQTQPASSPSPTPAYALGQRPAAITEVVPS